MDEYRVDLKVRNNLLLSAIEAAGFKNVSQFCDAFGMQKTVVGDYINLKMAPLTSDGSFRASAQKLMEILGALPEDLWTLDQLTMELQTNKAHFNVEQKQLVALLDRTATGFIEHDDPDAAMERMDLQESVQKFLSESMTRAERYVLLARNDDKTLAEVGTELGVTAERVRQIESKAHRKFKVLFKKQQANEQSPTTGEVNGIQPSIN